MDHPRSATNIIDVAPVTTSKTKRTLCYINNGLLCCERAIFGIVYNY